LCDSLHLPKKPQENEVEDQNSNRATQCRLHSAAGLVAMVPATVEAAGAKRVEKSRDKYNDNGRFNTIEFFIKIS
jgi:hypothetical protein